VARDEHHQRSLLAVREWWPAAAGQRR
jgi:hypothetical protein